MKKLKIITLILLVLTIILMPNLNTEVKAESSTYPLKLYGQYETEVEANKAELELEISKSNSSVENLKNDCFNLFSQIKSNSNNLGLKTEDVVYCNFYHYCNLKNNKANHNGTLNFKIKISNLNNLENVVFNLENVSDLEILKINYGTTKFEEEYNKALFGAIENAKQKAFQVFNENLKIVSIEEIEEWNNFQLIKNFSKNTLKQTEQKIIIKAKVLVEFLN